MAELGEELVEFLAVRDEPCPRCGYNLRGLEAAVCPECGAGLRVGIVAESNRKSAWVQAASSPALILGAAMVMGAVAAGWQGAAGVLVVWGSAMAGLAIRRWAKRWYGSPVFARGDLLWRAWVIAWAFFGWLVASLAALGSVMPGW